MKKCEYVVGNDDAVREGFEDGDAGCCCAIRWRCFFCVLFTFGCGANEIVSRGFCYDLARMLGFGYMQVSLSFMMNVIKIEIPCRET